MAYNQNKQIVYWKQHADAFTDMWQYVWNQFAFIKDESARVSATNCYMVSATRALGMDMYGCISLDENDVVDMKEVGIKQFGQVVADSGTVQGGLVPPTRGPTQAPAAAPPKAPYNGPRLPGKGMSQKQWDTLAKFANSKNDVMKGTIYTFLANLGVADITELPEEEAYKLLQACFAILNAEKTN